LKRAVLIILGFPLLASSFGVAIAQAGSEPEVGSWWRYDVELRYETSTLEGEIEFRITGTKEFRNQDVFVISSKGNGTGISGRWDKWEFSGSEYVTIDSGAVMKSTTEIYVEDEDVDDDGFAPTYFSKRETWKRTWDYYPPLDLITNTLEIGRQWTVYTNATYESVKWVDEEKYEFSENKKIVYTVQCIESANITVPAGTFGTFKLKITDRQHNYDYSYLSPKVGEVRIEGYNFQDSETLTMELVSYGYQPEENSLDMFWYIAAGAFVMVLAIVVYLTFSRKGRERIRSEELKLAESGDEGVER
jgi:hypothetical protein